jgi:hypothetical protein
MNIIIILSIIIIISLLICIILYFGIDRYILLHTQYNTNNLIESYNTLNKADNCRVVISTTTTPEKIHKIKPMLLSILDQNVKVDQICLNLPSEKKYNIPSDYKKILNIFNTGTIFNNNGAKIIPPLLREDLKTKIIALNDNQLYGKDCIESLINQSNKHPDNAIFIKKNNCIIALLFKPDFFKNNTIDYYTNEYNDDWIIKNLKNKPILIEYNDIYKTL